MVIIVIPIIPEAHLLLSQTLRVLCLKTILRRPFLLL
jgi:hypothetical protein